MLPKLRNPVKEYDGGDTAVLLLLAYDDLAKAEEEMANEHSHSGTAKEDPRRW